MAYFAFAAARLIVGGPSSSRSRLPVLEYMMAVLLATWALWIIDPVSRLGRFFLLGDVFHYHGPGFWFGLPLGSQIGFLCTSVILIGILTWMMRNEPAAAVPRLRSHPHLPALITYLAQVGFMTGAAFVIARTTPDPSSRNGRRHRGRRVIHHRHPRGRDDSDPLAVVTEFRRRSTPPWRRIRSLSCRVHIGERPFGAVAWPVLVRHSPIHDSSS